MSTILTRPSRSAQVQIPTLTLSSVTTAGGGFPNRYVMHAVEKFGKTSLGAKFPKPIFLESRGETGLETLMDNGLLPETAHFPEITQWREVMAVPKVLRDEPHDFKTLVIDTGNGIERLCHEHTCEQYYSNDWGPSGFASYGKGYESAATEWRLFLAELDALRIARKMTILMLFHTKVKTFKNPEGVDYDRYQADCHEKTWGLTAKWADVLLFGNFESTVQGGKLAEGNKQGVKGKGIGGQTRMLYTERTAAYDAGNRLGLPTEIELGNTPDEGWANFSAAVKAARKEVKQ